MKASIWSIWPCNTWSLIVDGTPIRGPLAHPELSPEYWGLRANGSGLLIGNDEVLDRLLNDVRGLE